MDTLFTKTEGPVDALLRSATYDKSTSTVVLPTVNVSQFQTIYPNRVCIARYMPRSLDIPHLKVLAPSPELRQQWRRSNKSDESWDHYVRSYWSEIASRCKHSQKIWHGAKSLLEQGLRADMRGACLAYVLKSAADSGGATELTLCCYEPPQAKYCHRKLIFDSLPEEMKGIRG